jgi:hypothetical protein
MLDDADAEAVQVIGGGDAAQLPLARAIKLGHKVALADIPPGESIVKYGVRIGHAAAAIRRGEWVHLHNLASDFDERSGTLDGDTGAPTDTKYE